MADGDTDVAVAVGADAGEARGRKGARKGRAWKGIWALMTAAGALPGGHGWMPWRSRPEDLEPYPALPCPACSPRQVAWPPGCGPRPWGVRI